MSNTRQTGIRLPELTQRQLSALCESTGMNQSSIVIMAIDRMYRQEKQTMKTINVKIDVTEDGMFSGDWSGVDMDASAEKHIEMVYAAIKQQFPDANVSVEGINEPTMTPVEVDGFAYSDRDYMLSAVEDTINRCYQDFDAWVVNA